MNVSQASKIWLEYHRAHSKHNRHSICNRQGLCATDDMKFPCRMHLGPDKGQVKWQRLINGRALSILNNPRYAGVYY